MQKLGQHFLKNTAALEKIVAALDIKNGDAIIEIGSGHGELTFPLVEICKKIGCRMIAIEKDSALAQNLESRIENLELQKYISVIRGDVLKILDSKFQILNSYKLVGNIPYYITGHLLRVVGELEKKPELCVFTIQKEVAERIVAEPPQMNRLAASVQFWAEPKIIAYISRRDFSPPPEVDSAIIKLETRDTRHEARMSVDKYYGTVRTLFAQPRKTILSNLSAENRAVRTEKEKIAGRLRGIGIDPLGRPQDLSIEDIKKISALAP